MGAVPSGLADLPSGPNAGTCDFDATFADLFLAEESDRRQAEAERQRRDAQQRQQRERQAHCDELRHWLLEAARLADRFAADSRNDAILCSLTDRIVQIGQRIQADGLGSVLDGIPAPGTPRTAHFRPLVLAVKLLQLGGQGKQSEVAAHLMRLRTNHGLRDFYKWWGGLADRLCGYQPLSARTISQPSGVPLPVDGVTWEAQQAALQALGFLLGKAEFSGGDDPLHLFLEEALAINVQPSREASGRPAVEELLPGTSLRPASSPSAGADQEFVEFSTKQRKLILALRGKGWVAIADVKQIVYGTKNTPTSTLERLLGRTNKKLTENGYCLEIKRKSRALSLQPLRAKPVASLSPPTNE